MNDLIETLIILTNNSGNLSELLIVIEIITLIEAILLQFSDCKINVL